MVPITFLLADALDIDPIPLVLIEVFASNIGGTATLIGDPPNILIAGATDLSFLAFIANLAPIVVIALVVITPLLYLAYRPRLQIAPEARERVMERDPDRSIEDPDELRRTLPILLLTIAAFFVHKALHLEPATVALAGATIMLLVSRQSLEKALAGIEWPTLFFFMGLFVMVGALEETGAIQEVADGIASVTAGDRSAELLGILWVSGIASGIVDNIPFTATMIPVVEQLGGHEDPAYWWSLSLGACFGGNATVIAAAANVAAAGMASRAGRPIGFVAFLRVGIPVTLASLVLSTAYVAVRYL
jgi:Na+/H+ antiporter NhaD/arsenite permease-like protein